MTHRSNVPHTFASIAVLVALACPGPTTISDDGYVDGYVPTWVSGSWYGGATIVTDRKDIEATRATDPICPARSLTIKPAQDRVGFVWTCTQRQWIYVCATKGASAQPSGGLPTCAQDPFDTPRANLRGVFVENDGLQVIVPASQLYSIEVFYCGSQTTVTGPPVRCK